MNSRSRPPSPAAHALQLLEQSLAVGGAVGDHERDVERAVILVHVGDDVLDRERPPPRVMRSTKSRRSQPEAAAGQRRDDDQVGVVLGDRVHRRGVRVGIADLADRFDAHLAQHRARQVDANLRGVVGRVDVDDVAVARDLARHAEHDAGSPLAASSRARSSSFWPPSVSLATTRIVRISASSSGGDQPARAPRRPPRNRPAARRPGRPRTSAPCEDRRARRPGRRTRRGRRRPTGTASKLKIGGGEETCHSIVSARHGLALARGPPRQEAMTL